MNNRAFAVNDEGEIALETSAFSGARFRAILAMAFGVSRGRTGGDLAPLRERL